MCRRQVLLEYFGTNCDICTGCDVCINPAEVTREANAAENIANAIVEQRRAQYTSGGFGGFGGIRPEEEDPRLDDSEDSDEGYGVVDASGPEVWIPGDIDEDDERRKRPRSLLILEEAEAEAKRSKRTTSQGMSRLGRMRAKLGVG